jgi:uncharacterized membrane protein
MHFLREGAFCCFHFWLDTIGAFFCGIAISTAVRIIFFMITRLAVAFIRRTRLVYLPAVAIVFCFPALIALAATSVFVLFIHNGLF